MASNDVQIATVNIGTYTGAALTPLFFVPASAGDITITDAWAVCDGAGTSVTLILTYCADVSTGGTPTTAATIGAWAGTVTWAAMGVNECTISTAAVDVGTGDGIWLAVDQASGTTGANLKVSVAYLVGK